MATMKLTAGIKSLEFNLEDIISSNVDKKTNIAEYHLQESVIIVYYSKILCTGGTLTELIKLTTEDDRLLDGLTEKIEIIERQSQKILN